MLVRDEEGGGGGGLTTSRNKSAIGGRNLFVDGPLEGFLHQVFPIFSRWRMEMKKNDRSSELFCLKNIKYGRK